MKHSMQIPVPFHVNKDHLKKFVEEFIYSHFKEIVILEFSHKGEKDNIFDLEVNSHEMLYYVGFAVSIVSIPIVLDQTNKHYLRN